MSIFKEKKFSPFLWFIYAAIVLTALSAVLYLTVQQTHRQSLNDPQIQIAEDTVEALMGGAALLDLVPNYSVAIDKSLQSFIVLYDTEKNPIVGNGYLDGKLLQPPKGVFDVAMEWGENRRTLEPAEGVRIASVIKPFVGREANGFVLAGRNMREVEEREAELSARIISVWAITLGALFVLSTLLFLARRKG